MHQVLPREWKHRNACRIRLFSLANTLFDMVHLARPSLPIFTTYSKNHVKARQKMQSTWHIYPTHGLSAQFWSLGTFSLRPSKDSSKSMLKHALIAFLFMSEERILNTGSPSDRHHPQFHVRKAKYNPATHGSQQRVLGKMRLGSAFQKSLANSMH